MATNQTPSELLKTVQIISQRARDNTLRNLPFFPQDDMDMECMDIPSRVHREYLIHTWDAGRSVARTNELLRRLTPRITSIPVPEPRYYEYKPTM